MTSRIHCYLFAVVLLLCATFAHSQNVRWDLGAPGSAGAVTTSGAGQAFLVALPGVTLAWCNYPANAVPCTNYASTYPSISSTTPCPTNAPIVLQGASTCVATSDNFGNLGVYVPAGTYSYTLTVNGFTFPLAYVVTLGGGGGSAVNLASPGPIGNVTPAPVFSTTFSATGSGTFGGPLSSLALTPDAYCQFAAGSGDQFCDRSGNFLANFGGVGQPNQRAMMVRDSAIAPTPGQIYAYISDSAGTEFRLGAPATIPNTVEGCDIVAGSLFAYSGCDAVKVSGWCNPGITGALATVSCLNYADPSAAIQAIVSAYGAGATLHVVYDMCGIQTWSTQPWANGTNQMFGVFEFRSNCPASNPSIISIDGISTLVVPSGLWIIGQGTAQGGLTPQYGNPAGNTVQGTMIRLCNPALYPCQHSGFTVQHGTVTSTSALSSNLSLVTMAAGTPFTTTSTAVNHLGPYRLVHLVGLGTTNNNAAWVVNDVVSTTSPQTFHITAPTGFTACASACGGTAYLDAAGISVGTGGGHGVYGSRVQNLGIDCSFLPGTMGWVNAIGQEFNEVQDVTSWNCPVTGGRIDQSLAYGGVASGTGSTNSGPYGPLSSNILSATCGLTGGCACFGSSTNCSSGTPGTPGTVPFGTSMSCGASGTTATIFPDPCVNGNYAGFLFTGGGGQQGFGQSSHITCTINDKSAGGGTAVPQLQNGTTGGNTYSAGGIANTTIGSCITWAGIHGGVFDLHTEYFNTGLTVGGDAARSGTYYYAYTGAASPIITSGVEIFGGFGSTSGSGAVEIDIGSQKADAPFIGDIRVADFNAQNGGSAIVWQNNVTGATCKSYGSAPGSDFVFSGFFGHSTTVAQTNAGETGLLMPQEHTSCTSLANFTGNAFAVPLISTSSISNYGVPVKADTSNAGQFVTTVTTDTGPGIVMGVSYHSTASGGFGQVVTTGVVPMIFGTNGTGNCAIGNFVIVDTVTNGHVKCTGSYSAGTVIGVALQAQTSTGGIVNVLVGLR